MCTAKYGQIWGSKVTIIGHENVKKCRNYPINLAIAPGKIMRHKWSARGKTMIKWSFHDLFLNKCTLSV